MLISTVLVVCWLFSYEIVPPPFKACFPSHKNNLHWFVFSSTYSLFLSCFLRTAAWTFLRWLHQTSSKVCWRFADCALRNRNLIDSWDYRWPQIPEPALRGWRYSSDLASWISDALALDSFDSCWWFVLRDPCISSWVPHWGLRFQDQGLACSCSEESSVLHRAVSGNTTWWSAPHLRRASSSSCRTGKRGTKGSISNRRCSFYSPVS